MAPTSTLSKRGERLRKTPPLPEYITAHFTRNEAPYSPGEQPAGYIPLCIAENRLVWDLLEPKLNAPRQVPHDAICYDAMVGSLGFRKTLSAFFHKRVFHRRFLPEQIAVLGGAGSVLELLFHTLCDAGDGVLVPTPSYAGFWADLETRDQLRIVPVHGRSDTGFRITPADLDAALETSPVPVKALLFTSPNNPLGSVYTADELSAVRRWAESREIHVVFDEIYALSVFGPSAFTSVAALGQPLGDFVHIVWAFSKDFAASGLRCGVLISENADVIAAIDALAYWACCSGDTQVLLNSMLSDESWLAHYIDTMRARLRNAHQSVTSALTEAGIAHTPADAGFFVLCDFRPFLKRVGWQEERDLWLRFLNEANVNLTPGAACRVGEPGFMRLCFAAVPTAHAVTGVTRLHRTLAALSR